MKKMKNKTNEIKKMFEIREYFWPIGPWIPERIMRLRRVRPVTQMVTTLSEAGGAAGA